MAIASIRSKETDVHSLLKELEESRKQLDSSRPTAVNLSWATKRLLDLATKQSTVVDIKTSLLK